MQAFITFKELVAATAGLERTTLIVLGSLPLHLLLALALRRPLASIIPLLALLVVGAANEFGTGWSDGKLEEWELAASVRDLGLIVALPATLFLACRLFPSLAPRPRAFPPLPVTWLAGPTRRKEIVDDAEFEVVG